jgi:signal transduction histidine kinase
MMYSKFHIEDIEKYFLNTLIIISIACLLVILGANLVFYPNDILSIQISVALLIATSFAYFLRNRKPIISVLIICLTVLVSVSFQKILEPSVTTSLSLVLIVGFIASVLLKKAAMLIIHFVSVILLSTVFIFHVNDPITAAITYSLMYFLIAFATFKLKKSYDDVHNKLNTALFEINEKSNEIHTQNEQLVLAQEKLIWLNNNLGKIVEERTAKIKAQNEILIKYSHTNAHQLRGPVARLLGLVNLYKIEQNPNPDIFIEKIAKQVIEIDEVIKQINDDLGKA